MSKSIGGKSDHHRHTLAILLSIPLIFNCFGFTTFAEDIVSVSITDTLSESLDEEIFEDVFSADVEEPVEEIEIPLSLESLAGEERRNPRESSEEGWLPDEDLFTDGLSSEGVSVIDEESAFEETSAPFEQTYTIHDREITITADEGVFPEDAELYVDGIDDEGIVQAVEQALGISDSDNVLIRHELYSFSGSELFGIANVKVCPLGLAALREEYPEGDITSYIMYWDGDCLEALVLPADFDENRDQAVFELCTMTVYDLVTVIVPPGEEASPQTADDPSEEMHTEADVTFEEDAPLQPEELCEEKSETISQTDIEEDAVEATDVINALVVWGDMLFSCREKNTDQGFSFYWVCENGSNTITVTNTSEATPIRAFYNYKPNVDGFGAPLYAFHSAEEAENAGKEMTHDGHDVHNLAEGFEGDVIAPGETEIWYVIFTDAPDVERALSEEDYLSVGRLSATFASAE